jgi:hypothetical protein
VKKRKGAYPWCHYILLPETDKSSIKKGGERALGRKRGDPGGVGRGVWPKFHYPFPLDYILDDSMPALDIPALESYVTMRRNGTTNRG